MAVGLIHEFMARKNVGSQASGVDPGRGKGLQYAAASHGCLTFSKGGHFPINTDPIIVDSGSILGRFWVDVD